MPIKKTTNPISGTKKTGNYSSVIIPSDQHAIISISDDKKSLQVETIPLSDESRVPISNPYLVKVKNASDHTQKIKIFAENLGQFIKDKNHPYTHVYSADPKQSYDDILKEIAENEIVIGAVTIQKENLIKDLPFILKLNKRVQSTKKNIGSASGTIYTAIFKMHLDPYQQQTTIINFKPNFNPEIGSARLVLDKNSWLEIEMDPDDRLCMVLFPASKQKIEKQKKR